VVTRAPELLHGKTSLVHHDGSGVLEGLPDPFVATRYHSLAVVESITRDDLRAAATRIDAWHDAGLATPLLLAAREFAQSLDAFPLEFGAIIADHTVVSGTSPFAGLAVDPADLRRAVEVQARGHLLHLRQGLVETRGRSDALAVLIVDSAPALAGLLASVARLDGGAAPKGGVLAEVAALAGVREIANADADRLFRPYLDAVEQLVGRIDTFRK